MKILLVASHKRSKILLKLLKELCLYNVTVVGSFDAAKKFLGQNEEIIVITPEIIADVIREFAVLKSATEAKILYISDWGLEKELWDLLHFGIDGYVLLDSLQIKDAINVLREGRYAFSYSG